MVVLNVCVCRRWRVLLEYIYILPMILIWWLRAGLLITVYLG